MRIDTSVIRACSVLAMPGCGLGIIRLSDGGGNFTETVYAD